MTNYGLGGLCEQHIDPHGYLEGKVLPPSRQNLVHTGDMIGTFMAWLEDVGAGGGTSYTRPGMENFKTQDSFNLILFLLSSFVGP